MNVSSLPAREGAQSLFSRNLARWRREKDLLLKQVAPELGVSTSTLDAWEKGDRFPTGEHLHSVAVCTGLPVCRLFCRMQEGRCPLSAREREFPASDRGQHTGHRDP